MQLVNTVIIEGLCLSGYFMISQIYFKLANWAGRTICFQYLDGAPAKSIVLEQNVKNPEQLIADYHYHCMKIECTYFLLISHLFIFCKYYPILLIIFIYI